MANAIEGAARPPFVATASSCGDFPFDARIKPHGAAGNPIALTSPLDGEKGALESAARPRGSPARTVTPALLRRMLLTTEKAGASSHALVLVTPPPRGGER